ncbi:sigma-70 family RNA polymerase sigma factor [Rhodocytophaga rosea]|uniref:RNA polymerase sigma factor n=1 Tax=Rhodocytophaga rosea TaxID=2704465 RepID=A0A6C0GLS1_9BACT|nr:sigma-70 family RNA polymerase sigma factor [Rhodocytophaga rosea]QHT68887.1 sigma-70 family RNA polymerase sigma factor [Rhodocytophaga rosea]
METLVYQDVNRHIVERCKAGDKKAQYELYKLYSKAMFNVAMRITNDYAEAEDVLQESFLNAFQNIHNFRGDSTFGSWLKTIVVNKAIGLVKKRRLSLIAIDDRDYAETTESADNEDMQYQVASVRKAIQKLPDGYRAVLSLYLLEGYDHGEIAEILQITEATSKSQYSRARKKLLELIKNEHN